MTWGLIFTALSAFMSTPAPASVTAIEYQAATEAAADREIRLVAASEGISAPMPRLASRYDASSSR